MKLSILGSSSSKDDKEDGWENKIDEKEFIRTLLKMNTEEKMKDFLEGILTPKELEELPHRLAIVRMLKKGISQHDIAGRLGVGVATVGRGSRELQNGRFKYV